MPAGTGNPGGIKGARRRSPGLRGLSRAHGRGRPSTSGVGKADEALGLVHGCKGVPRGVFPRREHWKDG